MLHMTSTSRYPSKTTALENLHLNMSIFHFLDGCGSRFLELELQSSKRNIPSWILIKQKLFLQSFCSFKLLQIHPCFSTSATNARKHPPHYQPFKAMSRISCEKSHLFAVKIGVQQSAHIPPRGVP